MNTALIRQIKTEADYQAALQRAGTFDSIASEICDICPTISHLN